jgi:hypothetical protein
MRLTTGVLRVCVLSCCWTAHGLSIAAEPQPEFFPRLTDAQLKYDSELSSLTQFSFAETPIEEAIGFVRDYHNIAVLIDTVDLRNQGIDPQAPAVSLELQKVTLRSALKHLLEPLSLGYAIEREVMVIKTRETLSHEFLTRTYPVGDLVERSWTPGGFEPLPEPETEGDELVEVLRTAIGKSAWDPETDAGIIYAPRSQALVVRQTREVQDEILEQLRHLRAALAVRELRELRDGVPQNTIPAPKFPLDSPTPIPGLPQEAPAKKPSREPDALDPMKDGNAVGPDDAFERLLDSPDPGSFFWASYRRQS